jgi:CRISPR-associated exonuclease Cas4
MYDEDDLLPIAALQHLAFCPRQWGLMYLEGQWAENRLTAQGGLLHQTVHEPGGETKAGVHLARGLRLASARLGLTGQADLVEFHPAEPGETVADQVPGLPGRWRVFPVEYKHGRPKSGLCDQVQLCAQALCLEEALDCVIGQGALFYFGSRHRSPVDFTPELRQATEDLAERLHELTVAGQTPPPRPAPHCKNCSLRDICLPKAGGEPGAARGHLEHQIAAALEDDDHA